MGVKLGLLPYWSLNKMTFKMNLPAFLVGRKTWFVTLMVFK
jgi:hypothetical protein